MPKKITGIEHAHKLIDQLLGERPIIQRAQEDGVFTIPSSNDTSIPRPKIILIDEAFHLDRPEMPDNFVFATPECREINEAKTQKTTDCWRDYDPDHGSACAAALQMGGDLWERMGEDERLIWGLAPKSELILMPVRSSDALNSDGIRRCYESVLASCLDDENLRSFSTNIPWESVLNIWKLARTEALREGHTFRDPEGFHAATRACLSDDDDDLRATKISNFIATMMLIAESEHQHELDFLANLDLLYEMALGGKLRAGDVIVIPNSCEISRPVSLDSKELTKIDLPIVYHPSIEAAIEKLTCDCQISVVISGGNSGQSLNGPVVENLLSSNPGRRSLFSNYGTACGAVIVGAAEDAGHLTSAVNHGTSVDVFGRYVVREIDLTSREISDALYSHCKGSSMAAMVAAAGLSCVQHLRLIRDKVLQLESGASNLDSPVLYGALKPFEARAHMRQWRFNGDYDLFHCAPDLMGPPPDIKAWLEGTNFRTD